MAFFVFILGLFIGSFLNVLADRLPKNKTILGRSHCDFCGKKLKWYDLIPLISFTSTKGRCRYCHKKLSWEYPISELLTGIIFILTYSLIMNFQFSIINQFSKTQLLNLAYLLIVDSALIVIFLSDLRYRIIPDKVLFPSIFLVFVYLFVFQTTQLPNHLISGAGCFLFFLGLFLFTKGRGMGFGDVKFAFLTGLFLGIPLSFIALYLAFLTGALVAIILILWKKKELKSTISFGPFMALGTVLVLFIQAPLENFFHHYLG